MIVEIKNFGPIESFTFDLNKDLHFIIGENGVGKSYASYCLYCVLKHLDQWSLPRGWENIHDYMQNASDELAFEFKKNKEIDITNYIRDVVKLSLSNVFLPNFTNSLLNTFSSIDNLTNRYADTGFSITIDNGFFVVFFGLDENSKLEIRSILFKTAIILRKKDKTRVFLQSIIDGQILEEFHQNDLRSRLFYLTSTAMFFRNLNSKIREVIFLPSSRSGLYQALNAFSPILAELSQKRFLLKNRTISLPALSEPISDYFIRISTLNTKKTNEELAFIVAGLEKNIIKGVVIYDDASNRITYQPDNLNVSLDISESSSMVSELSTIILILKHAIENHPLYGVSFNNGIFGASKSNTQSLLFIEEPEAHLHPELQIKLMQIFTNLIDHDIKLVITSHSDYMFNKLNNMILDHKVDPKRIGIYHMINTPKGSIVNPEVQATEEGMMDENFSQAAVKLYEERMEILERQNSMVL